MTLQLGVFISHSWGYSATYATLAQWIFGDPWNLNGEAIRFVDHSVPQSDPIHHARDNQQLANALATRINRADIMVVPTAMYAAHSDWMKYEIEHARRNGKKILAVNPRAQERKASDVLNNADDLVGWQKDSVVQGIWRLAHAQAARI